jgi:hypothetical protein
MRHYEGQWELIPELCFYEEGEPPASGLYEIRVTDGAVAIIVKWATASGETPAIEYGGPIDGVRRVAAQKGATSVSYSEIDDFTLDSAAYLDDLEVAYARRRVSNDGRLLATLQVNRRADGFTSRTTQVYRRRT